MANAQKETRGLGQAVARACVLVLSRQRLQGERFVSHAGPKGDAVGDGTAERLGQAIVIVRLELGWRESQQIVAWGVDCRPVL